MTPEKRIQNKIVDFLHALEKDGEPVFVERRNAGGFSYKKGIPDLYAVVDGIHVEIEVKAPGESLSTMQEKYRDKCKRLHIIWICADNVQDVQTLVNTLLSKEAPYVKRRSHAAVD